MSVCDTVAAAAAAGESRERDISTFFHCSFLVTQRRRWWNGNGIKRVEREREIFFPGKGRFGCWEDGGDGDGPEGSVLENDRKDNPVISVLVSTKKSMSKGKTSQIYKMFCFVPYM